MTARSRHRGHRIEWAGHKWVYTEWGDTPQYGKERPCTRCDNISDGPDFCLGKLPGVRQACCGHGHPEDAYFIFHNGVEVRGADAIKLRECWIDHCVTPGDVIEMYLLMLDVEDVYRLCRLCSAGVVTLPSVLSVIDTFRRNSLDFASICSILEAYSERNTNQETHMNLKAITNIQRQVDILSDGHQEVVDQAVLATAAIIAMDDCMKRSKDAGWPVTVGIRLYTHRIEQQLDKLQDQLRAQSLRALRVCDEIEQIKTNLKIS